MHGSNHSNCLFALSLTIEDKVIFLKNSNMYDDINTLTQSLAFFVFLSFLLLLKEYARFLWLGTGYDSSKPS